MITRIAILLVVAAFVLPTMAAEKVKILIIDGQNHHNWSGTTPVLKGILEKTGRFDVSVSTTPGAKSPKEAWAGWRPAFKEYGAVLMNYLGEEWPQGVKTAFVDYIRNGGGLIIFHAANNSFPAWREYNEMIGVGGWEGRDEKSGPKLYWQDGKIVRDTSPGPGGHHGEAHEYVVEIRLSQHLIVKDLPPKWLHSVDELYDSLRGPAQNIGVIATAYSAPEKGGTGRHEPMLMAIGYGRGRVFHDAMGHDVPSLQDTGFQVTFARGCEWAATGKVTIPAPTPKEMPADRVGLAK
ncbi:MAG TPA: ThuA domain-containing protein [Clostridia bacterium]|nr:ThuA domain-containing protein [Clostridia bacterium]